MISIMNGAVKAILRGHSIRKITRRRWTIRASPHNSPHTSWRPICPTNALQNLAIHKVFLRSCAFLRHKSSRQSARVELCGNALNNFSIFRINQLLLSINFLFMLSDSLDISLCNLWKGRRHNWCRRSLMYMNWIIAGDARYRLYQRDSVFRHWGSQFQLMTNCQPLIRFFHFPLFP